MGRATSAAGFTMQRSEVAIIAVGLVAIAATAVLWVRVTRKVRTEEHPVVQVPRANDDPDRVAYPG